jgi:hypothetical protein
MSSNPEITPGGHQYWFNSNRKFHREDGPAIIYADGELRWYINSALYNDNKSYQEAANLSNEDMTVIVLKYGNVENRIIG